MKHNSEQLALFGGQAVTVSDARGVMVADNHRKTGYKKAGKGWTGKVDAKGYCLDNKGKRIPTWDGAVDKDGYCLHPDGTKVIRSKSVTFETLEDMGESTGFTGGELKLHNAAVRQETFAQAFADVSARIAQAGKGAYQLPNSGYTLYPDGSFILKGKIAGMRVVKQELTNEELIAACRARGLIKESAE